MEIIDPFAAVNDQFWYKKKISHPLGSMHPRGCTGAKTRPEQREEVLNETHLCGSTVQRLQS